MAGSTADRFYALDRLIAEGEKRCAEQVALIERLNENGQSTTRAWGCCGTSRTPSRPCVAADHTFKSYG